MTLIKFKNGLVPTTRNLTRPIGLTPFFSDILDDLWGGSISPSFLMNNVPAVNVAEDADKFSLELAAPGLKKEDFKLNLEDKVLTVSVESNSELKDENTSYSKKEFNYNAFSRSFTLPESANLEDIAASYTNGILTISIPKKEEAMSTSREIQIS